MQKIIPHLWFDKEAVEAAKFYTSIFQNSKINSITKIRDTPSGDCDFVVFDLSGFKFMALSGGPLFKFNPSISILVFYDTKEEVDQMHSKLSKGGKDLMPLDSYPFSDRYAWVQDKYGLSWQLMFSSEPIKQKITPFLMFTQERSGKSEEAINFYASVFHNSKIGDIMRFEAGEEPNQPGTIKFAQFTLEDQNFAAMDGGRVHDFTFNEAVSLLVDCDTQEEIDYYWSKLSADPESEQCGWLKDKYGVSWQINPKLVGEMLQDKDLEKVKRVTQALLKMKKFDIAELKKAYEEK
ncbi:MAG: VOC family protein [Nanoarchaeota archaeon]|nr:VOC family protein [Nanoarchaeota archaeon]